VVLAVLGLSSAVKAAPADRSDNTPNFSSQDVNLTLETSPVKLAEEPDRKWDQRSGDNWFYQSYMAIWAVAVEGTVGKNETTAEVDADFGDVMDKATVALGLNFEAGKGPWSIIFFGQYMKLENDAETRNGNDADVEVQFGMIDLAFTYQVWETSLGEDAKIAIDALGGVRWTHLGAKIDINEGPAAGASLDRDTDFFDPFVGARARWYIDRHWDVEASATVGGFGVGSDTTWSAFILGEYRFSNKFSAVFGYRAINWDYDDDIIWDITFHGPVLGISFKW